jgi:DNA-binding CsgD family transcriptional regulator/tetratricopeptide (TPR) repeat protein
VLVTTHRDEARTADVSAPRFVGRDRELATIVAALSGPPAVVLVEGEAGIGKTRMIQELTGSMEARALPVLVVTCPPYREPSTLAPVVDALRHACDRVDRLPLTGLAGALRPLFPEWTDMLPQPPEPLEDAKASRHRLFRALAELLSCLRTAVLVVEDVHWADEVTLELLLFLASRQPAHGPGLVVSYRPEDVPDASLLLRLSSRLPAGAAKTRIELASLDLTGTTDLISSMLEGEPVSEGFARLVHERTGGVPLVVEESVRLLRDRADLVWVDGEWVRHGAADLQVPPTVRDATLERLHRLSRPARRVLEAVAVLADAAGEAVVSAVAGLPGGRARRGLSEAATSGLLREDGRGRVAFRHALMGRAVYESIPDPARRALHGRAGSALEATSPVPVVPLTRHFREAGDIPSWARYAETAAERASSSGDQTSAAVLLNDLLTGARLPGATRARLAGALAHTVLTRPEAVDDLHRRVVGTLRAVLDSGELTPEQQAEIRNPLGRLLMVLGEFEAAHTELKRAVRHLGHDPVGAARAMTYLGWPVTGPWPASTHLRWLRRAAGMEAGIGSPVSRMALAGDRAAALLVLGEDAAWEVAGKLPTAGGSSAERRQVARIHANVGAGALAWGRYTEARDHLGVALPLADSEGLVGLRYSIQLSYAYLDWFTGAWDGLAERVAALADADRDRPMVYLGTLRLAALLRAARGECRAADAGLRAALGEAIRLGALDETMEPAAALGRLRLAEGQAAQALEVTAGPVRTVAAKSIWLWGAEVVPVRVDALIATGQVAQAGELVSRFARGLAGRDPPAARASLAACRAALLAAGGDHARAAAGFAEAARRWEALPRPYGAVLARERQAGSLVAGGRAQPGLALLSTVHGSLTRLGASGDADRVARQLHRHGVEVPRAWRRGRRGYGGRLSPRELEVVRLLVAGRTNREIAQELSKSPRTVDGQIRSAMRKLNASSRTTLAVTAVEAGVVASAAAAGRSGPPAPAKL